jgi:phosphoribosylamine--glycine ligase/phosphoribosylaminoimidazole synthetase
MNDTGEIGHECGFAMLRLLKPLEYYLEKYGTNFYGLNRMYLLMEKQRNRGQDGAGVASLKLDVRPGCKFIDCQKSVDKDPIASVFKTAQTMANEKYQQAPKTAKGGSDAAWVKEHVPYAGELILAHNRYGTDCGNGLDRCQPVLRESNWMTRNLILAGNFNITNTEELFSSLVRLGQHPREVSDTIMLLEKVGHFVDKENNDLYVKYSAAGHDPRTCFSLIAETIDIARILRRASADWDGGYCIAGMLGHGDSFVMRDPTGIRPCFYYIDDEIAVIASEAPVIQTAFQLSDEAVMELPPGQALCIKRSGAWSLECIQPPRPHLKCSFERIYFSRGNDANVYRERENLGAALVKQMLYELELEGNGLDNAVLTFVPNTSELAYYGLVKEAQAECERRKQAAIQKLLEQGKSGTELQTELANIMSKSVRMEKVVHKDAKIRTFIQEESSREHLTLHAYDINYGTVRRGEDILVAIDDSIVRGNTLKNALIPTLARMGPKGIIFISSCPQIRYPDPYGIDMAKLGDLCAFRAAVTLLKKRGLEHILTGVYHDCKKQLSSPCSVSKGAKVVNHVRRIYEPFTAEELSEQICKDVSPPDCPVPIRIVFQTVEDLHASLPDHKGDWYFTGKYPTSGGAKVCCRAFTLWMEGSNARCYGVDTALSRKGLKPVLIVGGGGREHALAWKLKQSPEVSAVYITPGNGGTKEHGAEDSAYTTPLVSVNVPLIAPHFQEVVTFCREQSINLVVVGPEQPLVDGITDVLSAHGISVFGPSKAAAEIEASKVWAKGFMDRHNIPTAEYEVFKGKDDLEQALAYVRNAPQSIVVKASGLAAGKGVTVPKTTEEAEQAVKDALSSRKFGVAGDEIVIEKCLEGQECSILALCDGKKTVVLPPAQDHKRAFDGDQGPNTGGMGAFAPTPIVTPEILEIIEKTILQPAVAGMAAEGRQFVGCLFVGIMITSSGPKVLEFNCRFGDPETQVVIPLLDCDLFEALCACTQGKLGEVRVQQKSETSAVAVVMASGGYPNSYQTGYSISGIDRASCVPGAIVFHAGTKDAETKSEQTISRTQPKRPRLSQDLVTSGGRVLAVTAIGRSLGEARERCYVAVRSVRFTDAIYRKDIAVLPSKEAPLSRAKHGVFHLNRQASFTYLDAGVDLHGAQAASAIFSPLMRCTERPGLQAEGAGIGGLCSLATSGYKDPVLISSSSSVGTKLSIANLLESHKSVGTDLVALCVNDIASRGVQPLFFLNHLATSKLEMQQAQSCVQGISEECCAAQCTLLSAKTAEMPGVFSAGEYDLIGFVVGATESNQLLPKLDTMQKGDVLIGLSSSGVHSNGFSLIRSLVQTKGAPREQYLSAAPFDPTRSLGEALMTPTKNYSKSVLALSRAGKLKGAAHITSGGLLKSIPRVLPAELSAELDAESWELPPVFKWLAATGKIPSQELATTFNCGIGMVLVVAAELVDDAMKMLKEHQEEAHRIGVLKARAPDADAVTIESAESCWLMLPELGVSLPFPSVLSSLHDVQVMKSTKTAVLVGPGVVSPLQALVKAATEPGFPADIAAVLSLDDNSKSLERCQAEGIVTRVLSSKSSKLEENSAEAAAGPPVKRARFSSEDCISSRLASTLHEFEADLLVILDDVDVTILNKDFRSKWCDKTLVVQPSLLPAFPGNDAYDRVLKAGVCITGCTVHFLSEHEDKEAQILVQETTRVLPQDSTVSLQRRVVEECEWKALPEAVQMFASGRLKSKGAAGYQPPLPQSVMHGHI